MSSGLECHIMGIHGLRSPSSVDFFYILQNHSCPVSCWDWREEDPYTGGPFSTEDAVHKDIEEKYGNPGGYQYNDTSAAMMRAFPDKVMIALIEKQMGKTIAVSAPSAEPAQVAMQILNAARRNEPYSPEFFGAPAGHEFAFTSPFAFEIRRSWQPTSEKLMTGEISALRDTNGITMTVTIEGGDPDLLTKRLETFAPATEKLWPGERFALIVDVKDPSADHVAGFSI